MTGDREVTPALPAGHYMIKAKGRGGETAKIHTIFVKPKAKKIKRKLVLAGINFETGSSTISSKSYIILDEVFESLKAYPEVKIEIQGYTDNTGRRATNMRLSQERAESVMNYFIGKGISPARMRAVGYGPDNPIASNATREGRAENRRIELIRID